MASAMKQSTWAGIQSTTALATGPLPKIPSGMMYDEDVCSTRSAPGFYPKGRRSLDSRASVDSNDSQTMDAVCKDWDELVQISSFLDKKHLRLEGIDLTDMATAADTAKLPNLKSRSGTLEPVHYPSPDRDYHRSEDHRQASSSSTALLVRRPSPAGSDRVHLERSRSNSSSFSDLSSAPSDATAVHKTDKDGKHSGKFLQAVFGGKKAAASEITELRSVASVDSPARSSVGTSSPARSEKSDKSGTSEDGKKKGIAERHQDRLKQLEKRKCAFR